MKKMLDKNDVIIFDEGIEDFENVKMYDIRKKLDNFNDIIKGDSITLHIPSDVHIDAEVYPYYWGRKFNETVSAWDSEILDDPTDESPDDFSNYHDSQANGVYNFLSNNPSFD